MALQESRAREELLTGAPSTRRPGGLAPWTRAARRLGILGPMLLCTAQVAFNYLRLDLPASFVARHRSDPRAYHLFLASHFAYSDLYTLFWHHHLYRHPLPYIDIRIEYPVVLGLYMTAAAGLTTGVKAYFLLSSIGLWACALGCVWCLWGVSKRAAWAFALSPLLLVFSLLNWDLVGILFMLLGWRAWRRDRYLLSALFLTIGTFAKLYPIFLLFFCFVALARRAQQGRVAWAVLGRFLAVAAAAGAMLNLPFVFIDERRWAYFYVFNEERNQRVSVLYWWHILTAHSSAVLANDLWAALVLALVAVGALLIWRGSDATKVAAVSFVFFLALQKVYSPQYLLWAFVFAVIAEWDGWALAAISLVGLAGYSSAALLEYLGAHSPLTAIWYARNVKPLERDLRLSLLLATGTVAAMKGRVRERFRPVLLHARS
jgi:hypothetical protein